MTKPMTRHSVVARLSIAAMTGRWHSIFSNSKGDGKWNRVAVAVFVVMAFLTFILFNNGWGIYVWRHDEYYYVTHDEYFSKLKTEGRWLNYLLFPLMKLLPGNVAWMAGFVLFFYFMYVIAFEVTSDRLYSAAVAALSVQSIPLFLLSLWPITSLPAYFLLALAAATFRLFSLPSFYIFYGCLFWGTLSQNYYLLPLLHLGLLRNREASAIRLALVVVVLWAAGFVVGFLVVLGIEKLVAGQVGLHIAEWRQPHYADGLGSLVANIQSRLVALQGDLKTVFQSVAVGGLLLAALSIRLIGNEWRYSFGALIMCTAIILAHYVVTIPVGIVISTRTIIATFIGVLAFVFIAPRMGRVTVSLLSLCALGVFYPYWQVNYDNITWFRTVTTKYSGELVRASPLPPAFYAGLIVEGDGARPLENKINKAYGLRRRYDEALSTAPSMERRGDERWAAAARAAGFREVHFCFTLSDPHCSEHLGGFIGRACGAGDGFYCVQGVTNDNYLVVSFNLRDDLEQ